MMIILALMTIAFEYLIVSSWDIVNRDGKGLIFTPVNVLTHTPHLQNILFQTYLNEISLPLKRQSDYLL